MDCPWSAPLLGISCPALQNLFSGTGAGPKGIPYSLLNILEQHSSSARLLVNPVGRMEA